MLAQPKIGTCEITKPSDEEFAHFLGDIFVPGMGFHSAEFRHCWEEPLPMDCKMSGPLHLRD